MPGDQQEAVTLPWSWWVRLKISDFLVIAVVITPAVNLFWRGTWNVLEESLPGDAGSRAWLSLAIGSPALLLAGLLQHPFRRLGVRVQGKSMLGYHVLGMLYSYVIAFASVSQWRGFWNLPDYYIPQMATPSGYGLRTILGFVAMVILRTVLLGGGCPRSVSVDFDPDPSESISDFTRTKPNAFRGGSSWTSGYGVYVLATFAQYPVSALSKHLQGTDKEFWKRLALEDVYLLIVNSGVVNIWRGVWSVYDCYILPEQPKLSAWLTHGGGAAVCFLVFAGRSLSNGGGIGVSIDGEADDGTAVLNGSYLQAGPNETARRVDLDVSTN
ncbi:uncharacterized protein LOC118405476 [Branchiostoma floridae]|uniref:Uncharacterized protein LOC118405476 n=1 Tax=Branchiostoma floridae TaxID=7739 RepID=A0A9J7HP88_BRAFL|nr:uncharacterized protein LOC118405476 [Branchiostoma floridae]